MNLLSKFSKMQKPRSIYFGVILAPIAITVGITACLNANAGGKTEYTDNSIPTTRSNALQQGKTPNNTWTLNEWRAFSIYHPLSRLNEDHLFHSFRQNNSEFEREKTASLEQTEKLESLQILGASSLIPILRSTFGEQIRGSTENERDAWFTTHPSALFTPEQMTALCDREIKETGDTLAEPCWKPSLSDAYLGALTEFASDACPQLVGRELKNNILFSNKLARSRDYKEQNIRHFAIHSLRIPSEKVTPEFVERMSAEASKSLQANLELAEGEKLEDKDLHPEDLYTLACQALLLSKEFYTR
jgi:hypothetical protein